MIVSRYISIKRLYRWTSPYFWSLFIGSCFVVLLYYFNILTFELPLIPVSLIGTAVAFYVGFKNNNAYDRMWEARKIWGGIVNSSRAWGSFVNNFVSNLHRKEKENESVIYEIKKNLIYRHIAWLYILRKQLLKPSSWERSSQPGKIGTIAKDFINNYGVGLFDNENINAEITQLLNENELTELRTFNNPAAQLINFQSINLQKIREQDLIDDFRHMELERVLYDFYDHQGKCERIKNFPLPRQYANFSFYFVMIFVFILPFCIIPTLMKLGTTGILLAAPITTLISWVYLMMETVGDYSENPFQGMANDVPMLSICRTIEIDLRQMLGEKTTPPPIKPVDGVLM